MSEQTAYLLVFHGSRSRHYPEKMSQLGTLLRHELASLVEVAVLELAQTPLADRIVQFCHEAIAVGYQQVKVVPAFLSEGVHVSEDIPQEIARAKTRLDLSCDVRVDVELLEHLGSSLDLVELVQQRFSSSKSDAKILIAHGSRFEAGNVQTKVIADNLGAAISYWKAAPDLDSVVESLVMQNKESITIVPYFLFLGRITDAIASRVTQLQLRYPQTNISLTQPLGATPELARVIARIALKKTVALS